MLDKILSPFIGYWYWAQDRETPVARAAALGAPLVIFLLVLYLLFIRDNDGSSFTSNLNITPDDAAVTSTVPAGGTGAAGVPTQAPATGGEAPTGPDGGTGAGGPTGPDPTAFDQERYTVVAGDTPGAIAEKLGVPADIRTEWIAEMLALNDTSATTLQVGEELILPPF